MKLMTADEARELSSSRTLRARNMEQIARQVYLAASRGETETKVFLTMYTVHDFSEVAATLALKGYSYSREEDSNYVTVKWGRKSGFN